MTYCCCCSQRDPQTLVIRTGVNEIHRDTRAKVFVCVWWRVEQVVTEKYQEQEESYVVPVHAEGARARRGRLPFVRTRFFVLSSVDTHEYNKQHRLNMQRLP